MAEDFNVSMQALNPFVPGAGRDPVNLAGREEELDAVKRMIVRAKNDLTDQGLVFSGLRGVGKTVLLLRCLSLVREAELLGAYIESTGNKERDMQAIVTSIQKAVVQERDHELRTALIETLKRIQSVAVELAGFKLSLSPLASEESDTSEEFQLELTIEELCNDLKARHSAFFLFVDELQEMDESLMGTLITIQHRMGQQDLPFYIIAAGLPDLPGALSRSRSYAERLFRYYELGRLTDEQTRQCLVTTTQDVGASFSPDALDELVKLAQGYPFFVQAYGDATYNAATSNPIGMDAVNEGKPQAQALLDRGLYESRWQRATNVAREYMEAMARLGGESCSTGEVAQLLGRKPTEMTRARQSLIELGLIYAPGRGRVAFTVPAMGDFIRRTNPSAIQPYDTAPSGE
ncbi:AAA family ATPase [Bifidobacterium choloepi]|uniref:AAA family ATPase n=1 Tax=Bifidobacterium choloepi TaxID=2614131 RepID=A0A6I5MX60_9BIFI|nr:ATP-binding protein [Bifidobacterium choloepi]NEG69148.1 AAA family ATPase [Bifidobacterium choloepi]